MKDLIPKIFVKLGEVDEFEISIAPTNEYYYAYSKEYDLRVEGDSKEQVLKSIKKIISKHGKLFKLIAEQLPRNTEAAQTFFHFSDSRFKGKNDKTK